MRKLYRLLHWLLYGQMGLSFNRIFVVISGLPRFFREAAQYQKNYRGKFELMPCLTDRNEEGGNTKGEYFWQDLYVARKIFEAKPLKHIDIGSRIDGFVAHVACFREIEVFDIRPIKANVSGVVFRQADLMNLDSTLTGCCDSVSCLHALEHFGLGRYGDPIDPLGYETGLQNMAKLLTQDGVLYLSVPIGISCVQFNAHRIFDPKKLVKFAEKNSLMLENFSYLDNSEKMVESLNIENDFWKQ